MIYVYLWLWVIAVIVVHNFHLRIDECIDSKEIVVLIVSSLEQPRLCLCFCYMHDWVGLAPLQKYNGISNNVCIKLKANTR